ncbi:MAG: peptidase, partial [Planctomycetota bacterium]
MRALLPLLAVLLSACSTPLDPAAQEEARAFLARYSTTYLELQAAAANAEWDANTHIVEGDETNAKRVQATSEALAAFTGSVENIERART